MRLLKLVHGCEGEKEMLEVPIKIDLPQEAEENELQPKDYSSFDNYSKKRVTLVGYLIGLKEEIIQSAPFNQECLNKIKTKKEIAIIRALSSLRLSFLLNYDKIYKEKQMKGPFARFEDMGQYIDLDALSYLRSQQIDPLQSGIALGDFTRYLANINQLIEEHIEDIHPYIPEWIKWEYIKNLFIMPGCAAGKNGCNYNNKQKGLQINAKIHEIRKDFYNNYNFYPYKTYLNWNKKYRSEEYGNILFNDCKFLKILYSSYGDTFKGEEYVIDATNAVKNGVYEFLENATNVAIFVDCENVDPYHFAATLKNLDEDKIAKIKKIVLYDDVNTTNAWDILQDMLKLNVVHEEVERVKNDKSLVDHAMSIGVTKSVYEEKIDSIVIASSDSDFWSLIKYLPQVRFLVMNEERITSETVLEKLDDNAIPHCFMDKFARDVIQPYKNIVLKKNLQAILDRFNSAGMLEFLSADEMLEQIFYRSGISGHFRQVEKEKEDFFNKYLKKMKLIIVEKEGTKVYQLVVD